MRRISEHAVSAVTLVLLAAIVVLPTATYAGEVKAWKGTITIPTYPWQDDLNPKFWAMEGASKLSTTVKRAIIYPYTMQDHLSREKVDRTYLALFLENEYLKITCLPELGGRLHSVLDKTTGQEVFHLNRAIKPSMIAMRGAFISGGVEWNAGPQVHTVTIVSPVDTTLGRNPDGSAFLEISNLEKSLRTRFTVRLTLQPGRSYLDERISLYNPNDATRPYYFWNCTAQPNLPSTRFIYPMTLGTDHFGREFFDWPVHQGKDLSWLKNYYQWASIFSVGCQYDFFGAYHVEPDRGVVQVADHNELPGKKAWTWGTWEYGLVSQQNLTDEDGPYIEVQSGPLPTQSDYGALEPHAEVAWREWWYPVRMLGDGFEYATKDAVFQSYRTGGQLELRVAATGQFPAAVLTVSREGKSLLSEKLDLAPEATRRVTIPGGAAPPVEVALRTREGALLARFTSPLPIPKTAHPSPPTFTDKPDNKLSTEEKYLKGRQADLATDRREARRYYEMALADDSGFSRALRALARLDFDAARYDGAIPRLREALHRDANDGLAWYLLGACQLRLGDEAEAVRCGYQASRFPETAAVGFDLAGRGHMRRGEPEQAIEAFEKAVWIDGRDSRARDHLLLALWANGERRTAERRAQRRIERNPTDLVAMAVLALADEKMEPIAREAREVAGEDDFVMTDVSLALAELGMFDEAARWLETTCVDAVPPQQRNPLTLYYLAYFLAKKGDTASADRYLKEAAAANHDYVFASRPEALDVLQLAIERNAGDTRARLQLGNLLANLGRLDEAVDQWRQAVERDASLSVAWRNLGLYQAAAKNDLPAAATFYRKAIAARPTDQTLSRDLAEILVADGKRPEAIEVLEKMPVEGTRRADVTILLAQAYLDAERYDDTIALLAATPYFVNWEGQDITWALFNKAHLARGQRYFQEKRYDAALADFEAALTYPKNLNVGRFGPEKETPAQYWRGKALEALGREDEARQAWKAGAMSDAKPQGGKPTGECEEYRKRCEEALAGKSK
jgi:tetratricopeptide (TPR) repeat protein